MCGIAGFMRSCAPEAGRELLQRMGEVIRHRGPDACGDYLDQEIGLAHRRLSIVDLSPLGNQPMISADGNLVIVFNGEIYNFQELRADLERSGVGFRSRTDTEVILALYARHGVDCLERMNGMFAFALWDKGRRTLVLARDRIGKKPLYYYHGGGDRLAFASELKSLLLLPGLRPEIEPTALADYLSYLYIPHPKSIYRDIYKLPPAHYLELAAGGEPRLVEYWDLDFSRGCPLTMDQAEAELLSLLQESTACRMTADVPLGAFLSGGVDSSAVVALMSRAFSHPVKTCCIGFADPGHDEAPFAREVAQAFSTEHREYRVQGDLAETVELMPRFFDEPFADSSALPTYHVSRLARQAVTVALAGDGGDEAFGGYGKYRTELAEGWVRRRAPRPLVQTVADLTAEAAWRPLRRAHSLAASALLTPAQAFFRTNSFVEEPLLGQILAQPVRRALSGYDPGAYTRCYYERTAGADQVTSMLYTDLKTYLPGDILVKVDRMSMAHALEVRAPFLDYRVLQFAASLPSAWKVGARSQKVILKRVFGSLLPQRVCDRPKHGFTVPLDAWFRGGELKLLTEERLLGEPELACYLDPDTVRRLWDQHQGGLRNHGTLLWSLLMLALWHREYRGGAHV